MRVDQWMVEELDDDGLMVMLLAERCNDNIRGVERHGKRIGKHIAALGCMHGIIVGMLAICRKAE